MIQIGKRIKAFDKEIQILSPKKIPLLIILPIFIFCWAASLIMIVIVFLSGESTEMFLTIIWLIFWTIGGGFFLYAFLWCAFGREIIKITKDTLTIQRSILGIGPTFYYSKSKILNIRSSGFFAPFMSWNFSMAYWGLSGGTISFDYNGKTKRIGISLTEKDSQNLLNIILEKMRD